VKGARKTVVYVLLVVVVDGVVKTSGRVLPVDEIKTLLAPR